jgi:hypothetical protein
VGCPLMSPAHMPKRYPWTLHSCQRAMAAWVITRFKAQTQDAIEIAEQLIFDMRTGNWTSEANKLFITMATGSMSGTPHRETASP